MVTLQRTPSRWKMSVGARIEMVVVENERLLSNGHGQRGRSVHTRIDTVEVGGKWLRLNGHSRGGTRTSGFE